MNKSLAEETLNDISTEENMDIDIDIDIEVPTDAQNPEQVDDLRSKIANLQSFLEATRSETKSLYEMMKFSFAQGERGLLRI